MIRRLRTPLAAFVLSLAVGIAGVGLLVLPQHEESLRLDRKIVAARAEVAAAGTFARTYRPEALNSADLFRLAKAMPTDDGMPDLLLQLDRLAGSAGVTLDSLVPREPVQSGGFRALPIDLVARGSFFAVSDFLLRLRSTVRTRGTVLDVSGRLFTIDGLALGRAKRTGDLHAHLTVSAFVYNGSSQLGGTGSPTAAASAAVTTPATESPTSGAAALPPANARRAATEVSG